MLLGVKRKIMIIVICKHFQCVFSVFCQMWRVVWYTPMFSQIKAVSDMIINPSLHVCGISTQQGILGQTVSAEQMWDVVATGRLVWEKMRAGSTNSGSLSSCCSVCRSAEWLLYRAATSAVCGAMLRWRGKLLILTYLMSWWDVKYLHGKNKVRGLN